MFYRIIVWFDDFLYEHNLKDKFVIRIIVNFFGYVYYRRHFVQDKRMAKKGEGVLNSIELEPDTVYLLCPIHMGDSFIVASLAKSFKDCNQIKKLCLIVPEKQKEIPELYFGNGVDGYLTISDEQANHIRAFFFFAKSRYYREGQIVYPYDLYSFQEAMSHKTGNFFNDIVSHMFPELDDVKISQLVVRPNASLNCDEKFNIPHNSVLILPMARTVQIDISFFPDLVNSLILEGYHVYTNTPFGEDPILGTQAFVSSISEIFNVAHGFKRIVGVESGLCNVLSLSGARMTVLDSSQREIDRWGTNQLCPEGDVVCIATDGVSKEHLVNRIIDTIKA